MAYIYYITKVTLSTNAYVHTFPGLQRNAPSDEEQNCEMKAGHYSFDSFLFVCAGMCVRFFSISSCSLCKMK